MKKPSEFNLSHRKGCYVKERCGRKKMQVFEKNHVKLFFFLFDFFLLYAE